MLIYWFFMAFSYTCHNGFMYSVRLWNLLGMAFGMRDLLKMMS